MNDFIVNDDHRDIGKLDANTKRGLRPSFVVIVAAPVVGLAWVLLSFVAPHVFTALGGWVTFFVVVIAAGIVGSLLSVRRMAAGAVRIDKDGKEKS